MCVVTANDPANCGACGKICAAGEVCSQGACALQCAGGTIKCGNVCTKTDIDPANCGVCGKVCGAGEICSQGACASSCAGGATQCGNVCTNTKVDPANCGACGNACAGSQVCSQGACSLQCAGGTTKCGNVCVDTTLDPNNCGACNSPCPLGQVCSLGACSLQCAGGTTKCGNVCTNTAFDPKNCGACGNMCPGAANATASCASGSCDFACNGPFKDCNAAPADGCETNTSNSVTSCGACGAACPSVQNGVPACSASVCGIGACNAGFADCDNNPATGCEINLQTSNAHCGACGAACGVGNACKAGVCGPAQFMFQPSQVIDGMTVTCSSVSNNALYTECDDLKAGGLYMPNGITCGPAWSMTNSAYSNTAGFCQSLTGSPAFEVYYNCTATTPRATWFNHVWGMFNDNGYTQHVRCYY